MNNWKWLSSLLAAHFVLKGLMGSWENCTSGRVLGSDWNSFVAFQITYGKQFSWSILVMTMDCWRHRKENLKWDVLILKPSYWFSSLDSESEEFKNHNFIFWVDLSRSFSHLMMSDPPRPDVWSTGLIVSDSQKWSAGFQKSDLVGTIH